MQERDQNSQRYSHSHTLPFCFDLDAVLRREVEGVVQLEPDVELGELAADLGLGDVAAGHGCADVC